MFDFIGNCEYILARGVLSDTDSFSIHIKNVPCGTSSVTCSKAATLQVGSGRQAETLTFVRGEDVIVGPQYKRHEFIHFQFRYSNNLFFRISKRDIGLFISIEVLDLGVVLQWDKGNKLYVRLNPAWAGHVTGLCGNFNGNGADDFRAASGMIESSAELFGDSWKLHRYCPKSSKIQDTCHIHPHRKQWSTKKCGVLKSELFRQCRSEVPLQPYFDQCVFDTCGCNVGGDCECLCTAVSAYAQACLEAGVPVEWRSQELCGEK